jgi:hypothetical protein
MQLTTGRADGIYLVKGYARQAVKNGWLAHTKRPWALIIDDLSDPADLDDLWPVMMTAEKAADLILGQTPLPPEPAEFYRRAHEGAGTAGTTAVPISRDH